MWSQSVLGRGGGSGRECQREYRLSSTRARSSLLRRRGSLVILDTIAGQTIPSRFLITVAEHGDKVALRARRDAGSYREHTYRQYASDVARCAAGLRALGFGPGQRLVMMLRNRPEFHVLDIAATFCGGTPVSIYNSSSPEQIEYLLSHSEATIAIADDLGFLQRFLAVRDKLLALKHIGVLDGAAPPACSLDAAGTRADRSRSASRSVAPGASPPYLHVVTRQPQGRHLTHHNVLSQWWVSIRCARAIPGSGRAVQACAS